MARRGQIIPFPAARRVAPPTSHVSFAEVRRCRDQGEALVVRGLLESHGIHAALRGRLVHSVHPFAVGDLAEVSVLVAAEDADRARDLLSRPALREVCRLEEA